MSLHIPDDIRQSPSTNVSIKATRAYVKALRTVAMQHGVDMGDLVRFALDTKYGDEIKPFLKIFADDGLISVQSDVNKSGNHHD